MDCNLAWHSIFKKRRNYIKTIEKYVLLSLLFYIFSLLHSLQLSHSGNLCMLHGGSLFCFSASMGKIFKQPFPFETSAVGIFTFLILYIVAFQPFHTCCTAVGQHAMWHTQEHQYKIGSIFLYLVDFSFNFKPLCTCNEVPKLLILC